MSKMIQNYIERMKASFVPQIDEQARMTMDGTVVVRTNTANGKEWIGIKGKEKVSYPEEMLLDGVPVYTIAKSINDVKVGDVVKATSSTYAVVEKIENGNIYNTTFGGNMRKNVPVTDFLTQQKTVRVVVNPFSFAGASTNNSMMLLMMLDGQNEGNDLAEVMMLASMLNGQGQVNPFGNLMSNPAALIAFSKAGGSSLKDIMMLQMIQNGGFVPQAAPAVVPAAVAVDEQPAPVEVHE